MNVLTQENLKHISDSVDIVDVISKYIPMIPKGKNFFCVCPFHDDNNPSMSVSREKQIYRCFSCGATGNVFTFVKDYENVSFIEAVKMVADIAGISVSIGPIKRKNTRNEEMYEVYRLSHKFYQNNIHTTEGKYAKEYLKERQIDESVIKEFQIGLSLKNSDLLTKLLIKKEFPQQVLVGSGLVNESSYGYRDAYYNRIMFPLWDLNGNVVGFSGRIYHGESDSKYVNTKETEIFKKGELLYHYHQAKDICRQKNTVIVMEGFMDVIRAYTVGVNNVVATMGTAVTKQQAQLIKRLARNVILCFDGDEAGAKATLACSNELALIGVVPKVVRLEDGLDPDDYVRKYGAEKFIEKLEHPMNIMDFKLSYLKSNRNLSQSQDTAAYVNDVIMELSKIEDEVLQELTLKKVSEESGLEYSFLKSKLEQLQSSRESTVLVTVPIEKKQDKIVKTKYQKAEEALLYYMLRSKEVISMYHKKITYMPTEEYRLLALEIDCFYRKYRTINESDFITFIRDQESLLKTLGIISSLSLPETYTLDEIEDYINVIRDYNVDAEIRRLQKKMSSVMDVSEKVKLGQKILELKNQKVRGDLNVK